MMCQFPIDLNCIFNLLTNPLKFSVSFMFERSTHMSIHDFPPPSPPSPPQTLSSIVTNNNQWLK